MKSVLTILFAGVCLICSSSSNAQCYEPQQISFIAHAEAAVNGASINTNLQAGIWSKLGGFAVGIVNYTQPIISSADKTIQGNTNKTIPVATLSGRILISDKYLVSPYVTAGINYNEEGIKFAIISEKNNVAIGVKGSNKGAGIVIAKIF